ncbi:MAG: tRNA pseudouridine(13) synthase TruD, partial [Candidatus Bathyarchaeota archaeon]
LIALKLPVRVNWARSHARKLRAGQLLGNKFIINITNLAIDQGEALVKAMKIAKRLRENGLPNFYGHQRVDLENVTRGFDIIKGRKSVKDRWLMMLLISSYLDYLCNQYLITRLKRGDFKRLIRGDIAKKLSTGGMFVVEDLNEEQRRYEEGEISFTAPIYGPRMWWAEGRSGELEYEIFEGSRMTLDELEKLDVQGTRRLGRLLPEIGIKEFARGVRLCFFLPKGAYATVVLREIMKN